MSALTRKLLRDLWRLREQALAIAVVMACGVATFVMSLSMMDSLSLALDTYYERHRFAHVFAGARRAPESLLGRMESIPGVARVQTRVVQGALLRMPGMQEPATARLVSLPETPGSGLNTVYLRSGRLPEGRDQREALVSERFANAHNLLPGDTVTAILNGRLESLRVVGVALSPEFIYLIPPGAILPEHDRFAVFWMGREEMEAAFDVEGAFNDVLLRTMPGANTNRIIDRVDSLLAQYGGLGAYARTDHPSHQFMENELEELRGMTMIVPTIFLTVSAFLFHLVMSRLIDTQRQQIAALRALGYSAWAIGVHFLQLSLLIAFVGGILGVLAGAWLGSGLTAWYAVFFDFPRFDYRLLTRVVVIGLLIGPAAAAIAVTGAVRRAATLPPAEAMRPPAPVSYHASILERIGLHRMLPVSVRMVVRYLERHPAKTSLSVLGVAMATAILVVGRHSEDAIEHIIDFQFNRVQQRDLDLVMYEETDAASLAGVRSIRGVLAAEPFRSVAVRLRNEHRSRRTGIQGLARDDGLHHLVSMYGKEFDLPGPGIVLSSILADLLDVRPGESITVEALQGRRPVFDVQVMGLIDDFSGLAAYMNLDELNRLMREPGTLSGVYVRVDTAMLEDVCQEVLETPQVAAVNVKSVTRQSFRDIIGENLGIMRTFMIGFSSIIAIGVVYNGARVSLSERQRDLGTLRVVGFTRHEASSMQMAELAVVTALAIPVGLLIGFGLAYTVSVATKSELFRMPFVISAATFGFAALVIVIASVLSGMAIVRRIRRLDLMEVLKSRE